MGHVQTQMIAGYFWPEEMNPASTGKTFFAALVVIGMYLSEVDS